ncbi:MAG: hypothetical protein J5507_02110 [Clostridia bacterium]|nr:hypothetical protein [Clostridia bacterium]
MMFEKEDYIVKAKDVEAEIKHSIIDKYKSIKFFIIFQSICFFILLIYIICSKSFLEKGIWIIGFLILAIIIIILESNWSLEIKDRVVYIKNHSGKHIINYKDLVYFRKGYRQIKNHVEKVLNVKYLKKNKIIKIVLPYYDDEFDIQLEQICKAFITKEDIEKGIEIDRDYFYIRNDEENTIIEKKIGKKMDMMIIRTIILSILILSNIICLAELLKMMIK